MRFSILIRAAGDTFVVALELVRLRVAESVRTAVYDLARDDVIAVDQKGIAAAANEMVRAIAAGDLIGKGRAGDRVGAGRADQVDGIAV